MFLKKEYFNEFVIDSWGIDEGLNIGVTNHAFNRAKKRLGLNKRETIDRIINLCKQGKLYVDGINYKNFIINDGIFVWVGVKEGEMLSVITVRGYNQSQHRITRCRL